MDPLRYCQKLGDNSPDEASTNTAPILKMTRCSRQREQFKSRLSDLMVPRPCSERNAASILISDALPFGRLWYGGPNANAKNERTRAPILLTDGPGLPAAAVRGSPSARSKRPALRF